MAAVLGVGAAAPAAPNSQPEKTVEETGIQDGLLVHGLDTDAENVRRAHASIRLQGLYGRVSVDRFDGMAAAGGRLYPAAAGGAIVCFEPRD